MYESKQPPTKTKLATITIQFKVLLRTGPSPGVDTCYQAMLQNAYIEIKSLILQEF